MTPLEQQITELWGNITSATHHFLELVATFDDTERWAAGGLVSCAQWLNIYCGIGIVAAREKVRVAHAMLKLPKVNAAFRDSRISYSKVRAIARVATPENEAAFLHIALYGTASHVERTVRHYRRIQRIEEAEKAARAQQNRYLDFRYEDDEQHIVIHGRLPVEVGELVRKAIDRAMDLAELRPEPVSFNGGDSAESFDPVKAAVPEDLYRIGARRADALRLMAERFLAVESKASGSSSDRYQLVVHIDQHVLSGAADAGASEPPRMAAETRAVGLKLKSTRCEIEEGPMLAVETARRLGCDGSLVGIVDGADGEPLSVGRKTRAISPALARALRARDGGCRFPGCTHTRFTEGHHVVHWADGGETSLDNLITLCHFHHHLVHEGGFDVERSDDGFVFKRPDCQRLPEYYAAEGRFRGSALAEINRERNVRIGPDTIVTRWQGERMDYALAMDALLPARARGENRFG